MKSLIYGLIIVGCFISGGAAYSQPPQKVNSNYQFKSVGSDSGGIRVPIYATLPANPNSNYVSDGCLAFQASDSSIYQWHVAAHLWTKIGAGIGSPSPPDSSVQFNNAGSFGGSSSFIWKPTNKDLYADSANSLFYQIQNLQSTSRKIEIHTTQGDTVTSSRQGGQFWHTLDQGFTNPDGQIDAVYQYGYNQNGGGGAVNPNEAEIHWAMESHFQPGGVGTGQFEIHLQSKALNGDVNRHLSLDVQKANGFTYSFWNDDHMDWFGTVQSGLTTNPYFTVQESGVDQITGASASLTVANPTAGYNSAIIVPESDGGVRFGVQGSSGTPYVQLGGSCNIVPSIPIALQIQANASSNQGVIFQGNSTNYTAFNSNGSYSGGIAGLLSNSSTATNASVAMGVSGFLNSNSGNPIFLWNDAATNNGYVAGIDVNGNWGMARNSFGFLSSGNYLRFTPTGEMLLSTSSTTPRASVKLDVQSTTEGFAPPAMTTVQKLAIATPAEGIMVYDLTLHQMSYYNGTTWINF